MTTNSDEYYIQVLEARRRFLKEQIAKVGRWDETFDKLSNELEDVEEKIGGLVDDMGRKTDQ